MQHHCFVIRIILKIKIVKFTLAQNLSSQTSQHFHGILKGEGGREEGKIQRHMAAGPTGGHRENRKDMTTARENTTGQRALEDSCGCPLSLERAIGLRRKQHHRNLRNTFNSDDHTV